MDSSSILEALEHLNWFVVQIEALCQKLRQAIEARQREGLDTSAHLELLAHMEESLARRLYDRIKLLKELKRDTRPNTFAMSTGSGTKGRDL